MAKLKQRQFLHLSLQAWLHPDLITIPNNCIRENPLSVMVLAFCARVRALGDPFAH